jgi:hypothetical protein
MKTQKLKIAILLPLVALVFSGCTKDSDVTYPTAKTVLLNQTFENYLPSPYLLNETGWSSYAQIGSKLWIEKSYKNNGYAFFSSYQSGDQTNVAWLISPKISLGNNKANLFFQTCQDGYLKTANSLELYVSTDYNGSTAPTSSDFNNSSWQKINCKIVDQNTTRYVYVDSGIIDLSNFSGDIYIAFKYYGTSSNSGGYQIDNIRMFY